MSSVNAAPVIIGTSTLSFKGSGRTSTVIAIAAPIKAKSGIEGKNSSPPKNAKNSPANEPSHVFPLLNGKDVEIRPPKSDAALSPKQNMAMAA